MKIECHDIDFSYPATDQTILRNLTLSFVGPGLHALFGASGVGKSSLARIISGRLLADGGRVSIEGAAGAPLYAHNLERLPGWSSVGTHLDRVTALQQRCEKEELVKVFGLSAVLSQRFERLSLGQQTRINLLRYLVQPVNILLMDETLANVDEKTRSRILMSIKEIYPNRIFIYISHNVVEVATFCRDIWVLRPAVKQPQAVCIKGQDQRLKRPARHEALQQTMLEIMNAA